VSQRATTEHACVRVGPLSAGTLVTGWPRPCGCGSLRSGGRTVTGMLLAADDRAPAWRLEEADVIVTTGGPGTTGVGDWLRRYPGCAVAAAQVRRGECSVATRDGARRDVAVSGQGAAGAGAFACAVFIHGWLAAGRSLALLRPARLYVSPGAADAWPGPGSPLFFRFSYYPASGDDSCPE
jgi:hypothetical protein